MMNLKDYYTDEAIQIGEMNKLDKIKFIYDWALNPTKTYSEIELKEIGFNDFEAVFTEIVKLGCETFIKQQGD